MGDRKAKDALFGELAAVGKALANPKRLELLDLLAQGPRSVDDLTNAAGLGLSTCSAHLQTLRQAGLVTSVRDGKRIVYRLSGTDVAGLWDGLRRVAERHRPHASVALRSYLGPEDTEAVATDDLLRWAGRGDVVILDVRPEPEYRAAHFPGAVHIPLDELAGRLAELPRDREVIVYCRGRYCVFASDAVRLLDGNGIRARRAAEGMLEWIVAGLTVESAA